MKALFLLIGLFCFSRTWSQQVIKEYFFGSPDFYKENPELILITINPQSKLAENLGCRYYNDTTFIRQISETFYFETSGDTITEISYFCGHDLYFYTKKHHNLQLVRALNSECESYLVGAQGKNLELLLTSGIPIRTDTLREPVFTELKDSILREVIFYRNVTMEDGKICSEHSTFPGSEYSNAVNLPLWYYDGRVTQIIPFNPRLTVRQNICSRLQSFGIDSVEFKEINWIIHPMDLTKIENEQTDQLTQIRVDFLIDKAFFSYFDPEQICSILPQSYTNVTNNSRTKLLYRISE
jgi:hypothetical protein